MMLHTTTPRSIAQQCWLSMHAVNATVADSVGLHTVTVTVIPLEQFDVERGGAVGICRAENAGTSSACCQYAQQSKCLPPPLQSMQPTASSWSVEASRTLWQAETPRG